ncbi:thioredoxin domain-containing protein [Candidatus Haliotispira prima]|uniref:Thioredoxin domain-containing protein n=1 Tax=Candidatus Haliotispira prima TaxID=3034016 RepID=A0ABY8MHH9_9SPIO|nr:thioredoxin domain-containing protein [Candidatus Haliotispira prima]
MRKILFICVVLSGLFTACGDKPLPNNVSKLETQHALKTPGQVEVIKFFWLGCPHCREFHTNWVSLKRQFNGAVQFRSVPIAFDTWIFDTRVYVTIRELGLATDGLLANYYEARQGPDKERLAKDPTAVAKWLQQYYDSTEQDFLSMFESSLAEDKVQEIKELQAKYPISGVPAVLISMPDSKTSYLVSYAKAAATEKAIKDILEDILSK